MGRLPKWCAACHACGDRWFVRTRRTARLWKRKHRHARTTVYSVRYEYTR